MSLKDQYYERAEEIAYERYGVGFYELAEGLQDLIYEEAMNNVLENYNSAADFARKLER